MDYVLVDGLVVLLYYDLMFVKIVVYGIDCVDVCWCFVYVLDDCLLFGLFINWVFLCDCVMYLVFVFGDVLIVFIDWYFLVVMCWVVVFDVVVCQVVVVLFMYLCQDIVCCYFVELCGWVSSCIYLMLCCFMFDGEVVDMCVCVFGVQ